MSVGAALLVGLDPLDAARGEQPAAVGQDRRPSAAGCRPSPGSSRSARSCPRRRPRRSSASLPTTWAQIISSISDITGFTLPGMIELPGCRSGSVDLADAAARARAEPADVVGDLGQADGRRAQRARRLDQPVARRQRLEQVGRLAQRDADLLGDDADDLGRELGRRRSAPCRPRCRPAPAPTPTAAAAFTRRTVLVRICA